MPERYAGVMSGTSLDGIDAVVADFAPSEGVCRTLGTVHHPIPGDLRSTLLRLQREGPGELDAAARASVALADLYADAIAAACAAASMATPDLIAAGVHGQTVRHRPELGYTIQLNDAARVAERIGATVVADFRHRDLAAGGQGAPLVPAFHAALFARTDRVRAVLNLGGIANLTLLDPAGPVRGFDTGPGNVLLDAWHAKHRGAPVDLDGAWAASGAVDVALLDGLRAEPFFARPPPKSTGRDLFDLGWLETRLVSIAPHAVPADVQATLVELTARTVAEALLREIPVPAEMLVCGGGAHNPVLMKALARALAPALVVPTSSAGVAVDQVEALAFAWLARETLAGRPGNLPAVTGARGLRVLGAIHPR